MPRVSRVLGAIALAAAVVPVAAGSAQAAVGSDGTLGLPVPATGSTQILQGNKTPLSGVPVLGSLLGDGSGQSPLS